MWARGSVRLHPYRSPTHARTHARIGARCRGGRNGWDGHTRPNHGAAAWWWWRRGVARTRATRPRLLGHTTTHSGARARARVTETDSRPGRPVARCTVARPPARDAEEKTPTQSALARVTATSSRPENEPRIRAAPRRCTSGFCEELARRATTPIDRAGDAGSSDAAWRWEKFSRCVSCNLCVVLAMCVCKGKTTISKLASLELPLESLCSLFDPKTFVSIGFLPCKFACRARVEEEIAFASRCPLRYVCW